MTNPNDPAFPAEPKTQNYMGITYRGMTKREEFAKAAMQGLCANPDEHIGNASPELRAKWACNEADALIAELSKDTAP